MTKTSELLRAAKAKIEDPNRWTKGEYARDERGKPVNIASQEAVCWCVLGATGWSGNVADKMLERALFGMSAHCDIDVFNDASETTHADVMALFDRAIAMAESEEG